MTEKKHCVMIKGSKHQEDMAVLSVCAANKSAAEYITHNRDPGKE